MQADTQSEFSKEEYSVEDYSTGDESDFVGQGCDASDNFQGEGFHTIGTMALAHVEDPCNKGELNADNMVAAIYGDGGGSGWSAIGIGDKHSLHVQEEDNEEFSFLAYEIELALDNLGMNAGNGLETGASDSMANH
ncbi:hypothetical protein BC830DRAFT_1231833 [Chytriomyces sp. MP71]|nr:hypothetical protein BC830DRAFT_1231833 [Chytriomyces sp. MP71]